jgi:hypothetical protein
MTLGILATTDSGPHTEIKKTILVYSDRSLRETRTSILVNRNGPQGETMRKIVVH